jgi:hypothetical protein
MVPSRCATAVHFERGWDLTPILEPDRGSWVCEAVCVGGDHLGVFHVAKLPQPAGPCIPLQITDIRSTGQRQQRAPHPARAGGPAAPLARRPGAAAAAAPRTLRPGSGGARGAPGRRGRGRRRPAACLGGGCGVGLGGVGWGG